MTGDSENTDKNFPLGPVYNVDAECKCRGPVSTKIPLAREGVWGFRKINKEYEDA